MSERTQNSNMKTIDLDKIKKVHFIGIGGIGMSALARYFRSRNRIVSGYDRAETALTRQLKAEGISVHYEDRVELAPVDVDMVIYTPAIPPDNNELQFYRHRKSWMLKRSEVLGLLTERSFNICVAGTHGKTTVSTMIAYILRDSGFGCNAFLGGISANYNSNFWSNEKNVYVIEADEYDRSFLKLSPDIEVITAMDADHLDIYGTATEVENAFIDFSGRLKQKGILFVKAGLARINELKATRKLSYSMNATGSDIRVGKIEIRNGAYHFDVSTPSGTLQDMELNMGGLHNVENVSVAIAIAKHMGIEDARIRSAVRGFKGVKRRFEYILKTEQHIYIDDYAHHPEELRALISGVRSLFRQKKCTIVFQPHLYSRTRDFADGFAEVLDQADEVILLPIYPAREKPIEGVESSLILGKMKNRQSMVLQKQEALSWIGKQRPELLITAGAGDIDQLIEPIKQILLTK